MISLIPKIISKTYSKMTAIIPHKKFSSKYLFGNIRKSFRRIAKVSLSFRFFFIAVTQVLEVRDTDPEHIYQSGSQTGNSSAGTMRFQHLSILGEQFWFLLQMMFPLCLHCVVQWRQEDHCWEWERGEKKLYGRRKVAFIFGLHFKWYLASDLADLSI